MTLNEFIGAIRCGYDVGDKAEFVVNLFLESTGLRDKYATVDEIPKEDALYTATVNGWLRKGGNTGYIRWIKNHSIIDDAFVSHLMSLTVDSWELVQEAFKEINLAGHINCDTTEAVKFWKSVLKQFKVITKTQISLNDYKTYEHDVDEPSKHISERYQCIVKDIIKNNSIHFGEDEDISLDYIDNKLRERIGDQAERIIDVLKASLEDEIFKEMYSLSGNKQGIIIKGKPFNVAFSTYAIQAIISNNKKYATHAARLSAYHFSLDFHKILLYDGKLIIPTDTRSFMNTCSSFDKLCGWYDSDVQFLEKHDEIGPYIEASVTKAFVSTPDVFYFTNDFGKTEHLEGYYLSLFNACADLIKFFNNAKDIKSQRKFALSCQNTKDTKRRKKDIAIYQVRYTNNYTENWIEIDKIIYCLVCMLIDFDKSESEIIKMVEIIEDIRELICIQFSDYSDNDVFSISVSVLNNMKMDTILDKIKLVPGQTELNHYVICCLLNEIRVKYEDLRIEHYNLTEVE